MATINHLPPELLVHIQGAVDSPRDLHSLISASPDCLRTFRLNRIRILESVLRNAIPEGTLRDSLAFCYLPSPLPAPLTDSMSHQEQVSVSIAAVEPFLQRYFSDEAFDVPTDITSLTFLFKLHALVSRFADEYFIHAAQQLKSTKSSGALVDDFPPPSRTELTRLQRAFFRFELYCRVFPPQPDFSRADPIGSESQFRLFVGRLSPWEVEEMSCAHNFLTFLISEVIDDLQEQVVLAVLNYPGAYGVRKAEPYSSKIKERYASGIATRGRLNDGSPAPVRRHPHPPDRPELSGQSSRMRRARLGRLVSPLGRYAHFDYSDKHIGRLASAGLGHTEDLANGDDKQRRILIQKNVGFDRDGFADARLHSPPADPGDLHIPGEDASNDPCHPNSGYRLFKRQGQHKYDRVMVGGDSL
ncbi:hypothetical protein IMZ48_38750 [Candidatus Bathyarchaeota archaeon]|nr:hypothetical protein [Candidatus Bathyarchaeota archaeon]